MRRLSTFLRLGSAAAAVAFAASLVAPSALAGGPLLVAGTTPVKWARHTVQGGALNSQTVDATGTVLYHVDSGSLGAMTNEQAVALVDRIFTQYNNVQTSTIRFRNAGPILDPSTGQAADVTAANVGKFLSNRTPTYQNPIVFDTDGSITGDPHVLGFFNFISFSGADLTEGTVVLNGSSINSVGGPIAFGGVFTHEFGHFVGPLDHEQSNGNVAFAGQDAPAGWTAGSVYDLYAPFTETLFPYLYGSPSGSVLGSSYRSSGFWVASLDMDTRNALSELYPTPGFRATDLNSGNGSITGKVVIRTTNGDIPMTGVNVVVRRISQGSYPPAAGTTAYVGNVVPLDDDGVPTPPPARPETDSLATVQSTVAGQLGVAGEYSLDGLPPGNYLVGIQAINPRFVGGSSIGPLGSQIPLPANEYFNGANESSAATDVATDFVPVTVRAGEVTPAIDIVLNGFGTTPLRESHETEPNEKTKKAQSIQLSEEITGRASPDDKSKLTIDFGSQGSGKVHDLYKFTLAKSGLVYISLDSIGASGDLDMYLFNSSLRGKVVSINSSMIEGYSAGPTAAEFIGLQLDAGTYYIGVSGFDGDLQYKLRMLATS